MSDYLLIYGEGKQVNEFQFHSATFEEAVKTATDVVDIRKKQAQKPERFYAQLYQHVHEW